MPTTHDYHDHRHHFGRDLYRAGLWWDDLGERDGNAEPDWVRHIEGFRTFPNVGLAKAWVQRQCALIGTNGWTVPEGNDGFLTGDVQRGRWQEFTFHDEGYGTVHDAEWEADEWWWRLTWVESDGSVNWEHEDCTARA